MSTSTKALLSTVTTTGTASKWTCVKPCPGSYSFTLQSGVSLPFTFQWPNQDLCPFKEGQPCAGRRWPRHLFVNVSAAAVDQLWVRTQVERKPDGNAVYLLQFPR